jgi:hypothetical protein
MLGAHILSSTFLWRVSLLLLFIHKHYACNRDIDKFVIILYSFCTLYLITIDEVKSYVWKLILAHM